MSDDPRSEILQSEEVSFFRSGPNGRLEVNRLTKIEMPSGQIVTLPENKAEHLRRCLHCREPGSQIDWSVTVRGDRRAVQISQREIGRLVGAERATGLMTPDNPADSWLRFAPSVRAEMPDITVSQSALHDHHALKGALLASCAPAWWQKRRDCWSESTEREATGDPQTYLLGPPEEALVWNDCWYCEVYRYGPDRPAPVLPRQTLCHRRRKVYRIELSLAEKLLQTDLSEKPNPPAPRGRPPGEPFRFGQFGQDTPEGRIPEVRGAQQVHNLRDLTHALGLTRKTLDPLRHQMLEQNGYLYVWEKPARAYRV